MTLIVITGLCAIEGPDWEARLLVCIVIDDVWDSPPPDPEDPSDLCELG